jgi:hypothetical protein
MLTVITALCNNYDSRKQRGVNKMISKLLISLVFLVLVTAVGGFVLLAVWDVPVLQKTVEKPIDTSRFLEKKS